MAKCRPSVYAVIVSSTYITYGFRCPRHKIHSRRYKTRELRDQRLKEHQKEAKES